MDQENDLKKKPAEDTPIVRDKAYYENLYNDLPPEVVDILMKTHPLRGGNGSSREEAPVMRRPRSERNVSRKRSRPERMARETDWQPETEEVEAQVPVAEPPADVPETMAPAAEAPMAEPMVEETVAQPVLEDEPEALEPEEVEAEKDDELADEEKNELAQMVRKKTGRAMPDLDPKKLTQNLTHNLEKIQQSVKEARQAAAREISEEDMAAMEQLSREDAMRDFFGQNDEDYDYDDEPRRSAPPVVMILMVVFLVTTVIFAVRSFSLSSQLEKTQANVTELEELKTTNEQLKMDKLELENQLAAYEAAETEPESGTQGETSTGEGTGEAGGETQTQTPQATTYTVQAGDTLGSIARSFYGDFSKYTVIAQANGLSENATLNIGQVLTIPAQ